MSVSTESNQCANHNLELIIITTTTTIIIDLFFIYVLISTANVDDEDDDDKGKVNISLLQAVEAHRVAGGQGSHIT
jgi:hypothetical protein